MPALQKNQLKNLRLLKFTKMRVRPADRPDQTTTTSTRSMIGAVDQHGCHDRRLLFKFNQTFNMG